MTLTVSCSRAGHAVFSVADTGIGMTQTSAPASYQLEQADESVSRRFGGTGFGLSIVRELVHLINGTIELDSERRGNHRAGPPPRRLPKTGSARFRRRPRIGLRSQQCLF